jgi:oxygen-independent coproporphyrinogen-3 oxidase
MVNSTSTVNNSSAMGMYIHIPFCIKKCRYCDFYSLPGRSRADLANYTRALLKEIRIRAEQVPAVQVESIYLGGGTPSLLDGKQLTAIITTCRDSFDILPGAEISMEANPATLDHERLAAIEEAGINRLSLGVQSFFNDELELMGRVHDAKAVVDTIELLHSRGWKNFNLDLIYGLPGQSVQRWQQNLKQAVDCNPAHLSLYLLQLEKNTPMGQDVAQGRLQMLDEDDEWHMYQQAMDYLEDRGFEHYEISNFCRPGRECRHNLVYWQAREYIGLGAGAVSFVAGRRYMNRADCIEYTNALLSGETPLVDLLEHMSGRELMVDALILGLRLCEGIDISDFRQRFGVDISSEYNNIIVQYMDRGLLKMANGRLSFTREGYFLSNQVLSHLIG